MDKEELKQEAEEKYNERLKQNGIKVEYRNGTYVDGYMDSAEPREKRIEELEATNKKISDECHKLVDSLEKEQKENAELEYQLTHRNCLDCSNHSSKLRMRTLELEKENADLKCECRTCVYTDSPCVRSDYPSKDGVCSHYKNVFEENVELRTKLEILDSKIPRIEEKIGCEQSERISKPIQEINNVINRLEYERWRNE